jgi:hypothetical protein
LYIPTKLKMMTTALHVVKKVELRASIITLYSLLNVTTIATIYLTTYFFKIPIQLLAHSLALLLVNSIAFIAIRKMVSGILVQDLLILTPFYSHPKQVKLSWINQIKVNSFLGMRIIRCEYRYDGKKYKNTLIGSKTKDQLSAIDKIQNYRHAA